MAWTWSWYLSPSFCLREAGISFLESPERHVRIRHLNTPLETTLKIILFCLLACNHWEHSPT
jgi:hypothetical protein